MATTPNIGLYLTESDSENFLNWREKMNGQTDSNMTKIDDAFGQLDMSHVTSGVLPAAYGGTGNATGYVRAGQQSGTTVGANATAEGANTTASGNWSHAEGAGTTASGHASHAEGRGTTASDLSSHAEGSNTTASGMNSHTEGSSAIASSSCSHAEGCGTIAAGRAQHAGGQFNIQDDANTYAEIIGNGTSLDARSNARTLDWSGNEWVAGKLTMGTPGTGDNDAVSHAQMNATLANYAPNYSEATQSAAGLMSAADKKKLDKIATGATANAGTITGITMNGASKGTSGTVDLGAVVVSGANQNIGSVYLGANNKVQLYEDTEGGNLALLSPNGTRAEFDVYDNQTFRVHFSKDGTYIGDITSNVNNRVNLSEVCRLAVDTERHFYTYALNQVNIDDFCQDNYVVPTNELGTGTYPYSGWFQIINFGNGHFITQIAIANTSDSSNARMWARSVWLNDASKGWSEWREIYTAWSRAIHTDGQLASIVGDQEGGKLYLHSPDYAHQVKMDITSNDKFRIQISNQNSEITGLLVKSVNGVINLDDLQASVAGMSNGYVRAGQKSGTEIGNAATAEGVGTTASGEYSHAEGYGSKALGEKSHAEGYESEASNTYGSHAEGYRTNASGICCHAEGWLTKATNEVCHAEGVWTESFGLSSHAEGYYTKAHGDHSHSEGCHTESSGTRAHAEGDHTVASGPYSHAEGRNTEAAAFYQHVCGRSNVISDDSKDCFIIGRGAQDGSTRSNCFRVSTSGVYASGAYNSSGADYAEMFEWQDGNPSEEDRAGRFVTLDGEKIRLATPDDDFILGIVSGNASVIGDAQDDQWTGMYLYDVFGRPLWEDVEIPADMEEIEIPAEIDPETGEEITPARTETRVIVEAHTENCMKLNPDYDNSKKYIKRSERPEWDAVGMMGKLVAVDDGSCVVNGWAAVGENGIAVSSEKRTRYRVMSRLDDSHIRILVL